MPKVASWRSCRTTSVLMTTHGWSSQLNPAFISNDPGSITTIARPSGNFEEVHAPKRALRSQRLHCTARLEQRNLRQPITLFLVTKIKSRQEDPLTVTPWPSLRPRAGVRRKAAASLQQRAGAPGRAGRAAAGNSRRARARGQAAFFFLPEFPAERGEERCGYGGEPTRYGYPPRLVLYFDPLIGG